MEMAEREQARERARGDVEPSMRQVSTKLDCAKRERIDESIARNLYVVAVDPKDSSLTGVDTRGSDIPPARRVSEPNYLPMEQDDQQEIFIPVHTHPLTTKREPRKTRKERAAWRLDHKRGPKDTKGDRNMRKWLYQNQRREEKRERRNVVKRLDTVGDESSPTREVPPPHDCQ